MLPSRRRPPERTRFVPPPGATESTCTRPRTATLMTSAAPMGDCACAEGSRVSRGVRRQPRGPQYRKGGMKQVVTPNLTPNDTPGLIGHNLHATSAAANQLH